MTQDRDTHFQGFAKLLHDDLQAIMLEALDQGWNNIDMDRRQRECIAHHAYDLVLHTVWNTASSDLERLLMVEVAAKIPDLTAWPEPEK